MSGLVIDAFGGPGGASTGMRDLGIDSIGIEWDPAACATRAAAGHRTIRADVAAFPLERLVGRVTGLWMSPPCPDFSIAGKRAGVAGVSGHLIFQVPRWVASIRPEWVGCEQVPEVLPYWRQFAHDLRSQGYSTWCGVLDAADYGVPQNRRRAILMASQVVSVQPPHPTHARAPEPSLLGAELTPHVTMADALGWGATARPYLTLAGGTGGGPAYDFPGGSGARRVMLAERQAGRWVRRPWPWRFPSTTVCGDPRVTARCHHEAGSQGANAKTTEQVRDGDYEGTEPIRLTVAEASKLQGFAEGYPFTGNQTSIHQQIGNAVPPPLARAVVSSLIGGRV